MRGLIVNETHLHQIREGTKTQTRRLHKRPLRAGDLVVLKRDWFREWRPRTFIRVKESYRQRLGDVTEQDARLEGFDGLREFKEMWPVYTGTAWDDDLVVQVYEFFVEARPEG